MGAQPALDALLDDSWTVVAHGCEDVCLEGGGAASLQGLYRIYYMNCTLSSKGIVPRSASLVSDGVSPRLAPEIEILPWRRTGPRRAGTSQPVAGRSASPARVPPAGTNVRVGSTSRRADAGLVDELRRRFARGEGFDKQPMPGLDSTRKPWTSEPPPSRSPRAAGPDGGNCYRSASRSLLSPAIRSWRSWAS